MLRALRRCVPVSALLGCGGGAPLLHPAQPLAPDSVSFGAGLSGQFASSDVGDAIDRGRAAAAGSLSGAEQANAYARGVLLEALVSPRISPWISARVGLPHRTEAGLTYTGRTLRLDGRYVIPWGDEWALSIGAGGSAILFNPDSSAPPDGAPVAATRAEFGLDAKGWGADVPILVGYQPVDGFVDVWLGARAGFEHLSGDLLSNVDDSRSARFDAEGSRFWTSALAGFSLGVPPVWLRFELAGTFHAISGEVRGPSGATQLPFGDVESRAWSLAPSGALLGKF